MTSRVDTFADIDSEVPALTYAGTSVQTGVLIPVSSSTNYVEKIAVLVPTSGVFIAKGTNPTATANSLCIPSGTMYHLKINRGEKIAALQQTASGVLSITLLK